MNFPTYPHQAFVMRHDDDGTHLSMRDHFSVGYSMDFVTWIIVGLIAGLLASSVVGGIGYGLIGDIVVGIVGAVIGGWLFATLGVSLPFSGIAATITIAFIGAIVLLLIIRALRPGTRLRT